VQSAQTQFAQLSVHPAQAQALWLHVTHEQSAQLHIAHTSVQWVQVQAVHSS
jgi:hypothetical protein